MKLRVFSCFVDKKLKTAFSLLKLVSILQFLKYNFHILDGLIISCRTIQKLKFGIRNDHLQWQCEIFEYTCLA